MVVIFVVVIFVVIVVLTCGGSLSPMIEDIRNGLTAAAVDAAVDVGEGEVAEVGFSEVA